MELVVFITQSPQGAPGSALELVLARDAEKCLCFIQTKSPVNPSRCAEGGDPGCVWGQGLSSADLQTRGMA